MAFSQICLSDGRELTGALEGEKVVGPLNDALGHESEMFGPFNTTHTAGVWISPQHLEAVADRLKVD